MPAVGADTVIASVLQVLRAHPAGIGEYDLIRALAAEGQQDFARERLRDNLSLFQTHFLLFHTLYLLRDDLARRGEARLDIHPLKIQLLPLADACGYAVDAHDPLRDYYLDMHNLATGRDEVERLLNDFWNRFASNDERAEALDALGLVDPVDWPTIKHRHRRLAMQHHPDRGGDTASLQAINAALDVLARHRE